MNTVRITILSCFLILLGVPFLFRSDTGHVDRDAPSLIIITPHNDQIRAEFGRAFSAWHLERFGGPVEVVWNVPGGTSEIRKMLESQYRASLIEGTTAGGAADLVWGGGTYIFDQLAQKITDPGASGSVRILQPVQFDAQWLQEVFGENAIGDGRLFDPQGNWFGTALSGFGIVFNRDVLAELNASEPQYWVDLGHPSLLGWVALVNPGQSGSITTAFEAILQQRGWEQGWRILRRAAANSRYFSATSRRPPIDVSSGNAAAGICIDFYGRYQSQKIKEAGGGDRVGYVDPPGVSTIDADPIAMLNGAPHPELARRFIEFVLSEAGQTLWQFPARSEKDEFGPYEFELRRMPSRRDIYDRHLHRFVDPVNPFELARQARYPDRNMRSFITILFSSMAIDNHDQLRESWQVITSHPSYPNTRGLITADDVADSQLRSMLRMFDAMPVVATPDGGSLSLQTSEHLDKIKQGWLKSGWADAGLWPPEARPVDAIRRDAAAFFRDQYEQIVQLSRDDG